MKSFEIKGASESQERLFDWMEIPIAAFNHVYPNLPVT